MLVEILNQLKELNHSPITNNSKTHRKIKLYNCDI